MNAIFSISIVTAAFVSMRKPHVYHGEGVPAISLMMTRQEWNASRR